MKHCQKCHGKKYCYLDPENKLGRMPCGECQKPTASPQTLPKPPDRLRMTAEEQRILSKLDHSMHVNDEAWEVVSRLEDRGWIRGHRITTDGYEALYWYRNRSISA